MGFLILLLVASEVLPFVRGLPGNGIVHTLATYAVNCCQRELDDRRRLSDLAPRPEEPPPPAIAVAPSTPPPRAANSRDAWHIVPDHPLAGHR